MGVKKRERNVNLGRCSLLDLESGHVLWATDIAERYRQIQWGKKELCGKSSLGDSDLTWSTYVVTRHPWTWDTILKGCALICEMKNNFCLLSVADDKEETFPRLHTVQLLWASDELGWAEAVRISESRATQNKGKLMSARKLKCYRMCPKKLSGGRPSEQLL